MKIVEPRVAVDAIPDHSIAIVPGGCASATAFYAALMDSVERFDELTLCCGFSFGDYPFLQNGLGEHTRYLTWQASPRLRSLFKESDPRKVGYVPIRLADVHRVIGANGEIHPHTVVVQTSTPLDGREVSLGISVGPYLDFVRSAKLVIAEFNPNMPVTHGECRIPLDAIDYAYESDSAIVEYRTPPAQESDLSIVDHVMSLIPDGAWVQLGIGSVPDRIMLQLKDIPDIKLWSGLLTGGLQDFIEGSRGKPEIVAGELAGEQSFYAFCNDHRGITMAPTSVTHDLARVAALPKFISINSALEIDLQGQTNGEAIGDVQISGVGGALDYMEAAVLSPGGISIMAMPSVTADGKRSKIVARFPAGGVVTAPRYCTDYVVTEYGIARLRGKDLHQRAEALIAIAHPQFRDELAGALR